MKVAVVRLDMICRCSPEGKEQAGRLRQEVMRRLNERGSAETATDANLLTHVVVSLNWDYGAEITGIHNDMWSRVTAETWHPDHKEKRWLRVSVECDDVEDGVAAIWKAFADRHREGEENG